jgi:hypothetical protein
VVSAQAEAAREDSTEGFGPSGTDLLTHGVQFGLDIALLLQGDIYDLACMPSEGVFV